MSDFNKVILLGRIGNDLELKTSSSGKSYLRLSIATHSFRSGNEKTTHWHRVMVFGPQADICAKYLKKGSVVLVEGMLECRVYTNAEGQRVNFVSVISNRIQFLGGRMSASVEDSSAESDENDYEGTRASGYENRELSATA